MNDILSLSERGGAGTLPRKLAPPPCTPRTGRRYGLPDIDSKATRPTPPSKLSLAHSNLLSGKLNLKSSPSNPLLPRTNPYYSKTPEQSSMSPDSPNVPLKHNSEWRKSYVNIAVYNNSSDFVCLPTSSLVHKSNTNSNSNPLANQLNTQDKPCNSQFSSNYQTSCVKQPNCVMITTTPERSEPNTFLFTTLINPPTTLQTRVQSSSALKSDWSMLETKPCFPSSPDKIEVPNSSDKYDLVDFSNIFLFKDDIPSSSLASNLSDSEFSEYQSGSIKPTFDTNPNHFSIPTRTLNHGTLSTVQGSSSNKLIEKNPFKVPLCQIPAPDPLDRSREIGEEFFSTLVRSRVICTNISDPLAAPVVLPTPSILQSGKPSQVKSYITSYFTVFPLFRKQGFQGAKLKLQL